MVVISEEKCAGCGFCQMICPREAMRLWGFARIDRERCTECFEGMHRFGINEQTSDRAALLKLQEGAWEYACVSNCPAGALSRG